VYEYRGALRELLYQYKFRGHRSLSLFFAEVLAEQWRCRCKGAPLVPVPARPGLKRRQGWEHVEQIALQMSRAHRIPVLGLLRRKPTPPQKRLGFEARKGNLRGAVTTRRCVSSALVLVDDLITTGATAEECSRVLLEAGAASVDVLALAVDL
jgi:ComF family protein